MGYTDNARSRRVDFFKASDKWYSTKAIVFRRDREDVDSLAALKNGSKY